MILRKYILLAITACFINVSFIYAQNDTDSIAVNDKEESRNDIGSNDAEAAYKSKNFTESIKLYEDQIEKHKLNNEESAQLYYNLGNAYFRDNQIAKAIVNYERALLLEPGDSDIRHNLQFAKKQIEDKIDSADIFFVNKWIRSIQNTYSANTWGGIAIAAFILLIVAAGFYMVSVQITWRKVAFYTGIALLSIVIITNVFAFKQKDKIVNRSTGIVMTASASIYTSPDPHSQELFRLHEGTKFKVKRKEDKWIEIVIANGSVGWLQTKNIEII